MQRIENAILCLLILLLFLAVALGADRTVVERQPNYALTPSALIQR